jgi:hypothetical protein
MNDIITPAALKAVAKRIRETESERLGQKLPNNTVLNLLTQGFGLGQSFSAFANAADRTESKVAVAVAAQAKTSEPAEGALCYCVAYGYVLLRVSDFENHPDGPLFSIDQQKAMQVALGEIWCIEAEWVANGLQKVSISKYRNDLSYDDALRKVTSITEFLRSFIETNLPEIVQENPIIDHFSGVDILDQDAPQLRISYHIKDGYHAETQVSRNLWEAALEKNISEAEALIVLHETDEVEAEVTPEDIVIDEIMQEAAPYERRKAPNEPPSSAPKPKAPTSHKVFLIYEIDQSQFGRAQYAFNSEELEAIHEDAPEALNLEIRHVAHGYQVITFEVASRQITQIGVEIEINSAIDTIKHLVSHHAPGFLEDAKLVNDAIVVPITDEEEEFLHVCFEQIGGEGLYTECVLKSEWDVFWEILPQETCLLLLVQDYEFSERQTEEDIIFHQVLSDFKPYQG